MEARWTPSAMRISTVILAVETNAKAVQQTRLLLDWESARPVSVVDVLKHAVDAYFEQTQH